VIHDIYGILCQDKDQDLGDGPHRNGLFQVYLAMTGKWQLYYEWSQKLVAACLTPQGWIRGGKWNDPRDFSRDQGSRLMLGFAMSQRVEDIAHAKAYYATCLKRSGTHPNGDLMAVGCWAFVIRLFGLWPFYPLLLILDLRFVVDPFIMSKWDGASLVVPDYFYAEKRYWTPWVWLGKKIITRKASTAEADMIHNHTTTDKVNGCIELLEVTRYFFARLRGEK
jgi:hypothetical protein